MGMQQARAWNCGSLNEFRKFFGLKTYDTFEEINRDPYIADQLRRLYGKSFSDLVCLLTAVQSIQTLSNSILVLSVKRPKNP